MFNIRFILTLLNINQIGRKTINELIKYEPPEKLDEVSIFNYLNKYKNMIKRIPLIRLEDIIVAKYKCEEIILKCKKLNINIITILDGNFPQKLKYIDDNPVIIYYKGNFDCIKNNKSIALIGTRNPSNEGIETSYCLGNILCQKNYVIISGLAVGCDTWAHKSVIDNNKSTVAVMPCGLNNIYPKQNEELFNNIIRNKGCVISEYEPDEKPKKYQFIERDRLQSALSDGVILVEASINSGSMHTVEFAYNQNKIVGYCSFIKNNQSRSKYKYIYDIYNKSSLNEFLIKIEDYSKINTHIITNNESIQITFNI